MSKIQTKTFITHNVTQALKQYEEENLIPSTECDFSIIKLDTYLKSNANQEYELYTKEILQKILNKDKIINENISFKQNYTIEVAAKKKQDIDLNYNINFSEYYTHPKLILYPTSKISYKNYKPIDLLKILFKEFNKIKVSHKILINIFDDEMKKTLKILVKYIYAQKFVKRVAIPLFSGIEPLIARKSELTLLFQEKEQKNELLEVEKNELLVRYQKPLFGKKGLTAFGELIDNEYSHNINDLNAVVDLNSIRIEEDENYKDYYSKVKGYIYYDGKSLRVDNKIRLNEISRNKEIIDKELHNNIEVIISQEDASRDSIKEGVDLVSETIHVDGFVGAKSRLEAVNLEVKGATHQDSKQIAKFATINRHKGTLRCHEAKISLLEGGVVHATTAIIDSCIGGEIHAQDVTINHVKNNLKVYASNSITIKLVSGEDNTFEINYQKVPVITTKIEYIEKNIEELKYKLSQAKLNNLDKVEDIKKEIQTLREDIKKIEESYKSAKISITQAFRGLNTIIFSIDSDNTIKYKTKNKAYNDFHLEITEELIILHPVEQSIPIQ
ncbi:hypothetical protein [Sulfurimonas sp.]|uniref:hypothetical protein n=1 Tax=Sulfurimonas sp. TaxID=2022749 RepID=UPI0026146AE2|nr:hypothetical protein [Sulfurimonas sp.]